MSFTKRVNALRRRITHNLTKNIGGSGNLQNTKFTSPGEIKKVLICRPNHRLGNLLLITPLVQEVTATFPNCKIDLFTKGFLGSIIFENYGSVATVIPLPKKHFEHLFQYLSGWTALKKKNYDLVINVEKGSSSGRLSTRFARAKFKSFGDEEPEIHNGNKEVHNAKYPVIHFRNFVTRLGFPKREAPIPLLNLKLSSEELAKGKEALHKVVDCQKEILCIFTYATGGKCYSESWWEAFYNRLKKEFPNYHILEVLPVENVSQINFKAPTFYSRDVREIAALIANTKTFIGADSGIMHLASAAQIPVIGLFSSANIPKYEPYGNGSLGLNTNEGDLDSWMETVQQVLSKNKNNLEK